MANGDHLVIGLPGANLATSVTTLVHTGGGPAGFVSDGLWVARTGAPLARAAIGGANYSSGAVGPGMTPAGVMGITSPASGRIGVLGTTDPGPPVFWGETGVMGVTNSFGVVGVANTGVVAAGPQALVAGTGVVGHCDDGVGVHGVATRGWGVIGESVGNDGVTGLSRGGIGAYGESDRIGVLGESNHAQGVGVWAMAPTRALDARTTGNTSTAVAVSAWSDTGTAVRGFTGPGVAVMGRAAGGWAGYFVGRVAVRGDFFVVGGAKSAAVPHPDGSHRALFCLESPESYFEDFGEVELKKDSVVVRLEKNFAALVTRKKYQVFLTSYGPEAVYVRRRSAGEFEIARVDPSTDGKYRKLNVGYRIVARRADVKPARLPKVKLPVPSAKIGANDPIAPKRKDGRRRAPGTPRIPKPDVAAIREVTPIEAE